MGIFRRSLAAAAAVVGAVALASAAYQTWASARDRRRFPPPGRLVDVDGRRIHLWIAGTGSPAIVLIPALGTPSVEFAPLLPVLAEETTVVIFDRAGLGWSDPVANPMALLGAPGDLHAALCQAGIGPPYVLAAHSMGSLVLLPFVTAHRSEVAGVVLIDASHPDQANRIPGYHWRTLRYTIADSAKPYGLLRLAQKLGVRSSSAPAGWADSHADAYAAMELGNRQRRTTWWERVLRAQLGSAANSRSRSLGDVPLTVVTCSEVPPAAETPKQVAFFREHFRTWYPLQVDLARLSSDSRHVVAEKAGHYIHRGQPELVTDAILDVVRRARSWQGETPAEQRVEEPPD